MKHVTTWLLFVGLLLLSCEASSSEAECPSLARSENFEADIPAYTIRKICLPKGYHEGVFLEGENIWVNNGSKIDTWVINQADSSVVRRIKPVATFTEGMAAAEDGRLFVTDWNEKKLYRVTIEEERMKPESEMSFAPAHPTGVAWTGEHLFVITWTRGLSGTKFHLVQMKGGGEIIKRFLINGIHEPAHITWDGKSLWITSWYNQRVYKVDTDLWNIVGAFRSPAIRTTGIAWDGRYFWLTGTHEDLYQVRIDDEPLSQPD